MSDRTAFLALLPKHSRGVEVGVWKGEFSREILDVVQPASLLLVDPWEQNDDVTNISSTMMLSQKAIDEVYKSVCQSMRGESSVIVRRQRSLDAAKWASLLVFDWVYIDARHDYEHVSEDLAAWWPRVAHGGMICGHDVHIEGVQRAADEFALAHSINAGRIGDNFLISKPAEVL